MNDYDYIYKIVTAGNSGVGKTSILLRYVNSFFDEYTESTVGIDFFTSKLPLTNNETVKLQIWDLAGQYEFNNIVKSYFRNIHGAILVFDITNRSSFNNIEEWIKKIKTDKDYINNDVKMVLVGTKYDLQKVFPIISESEINDLLSRHPYIIKYIKASSKTDKNINEIFETLVNGIYDYNLSIGESFRGKAKIERLNLNKVSLIQDEDDSDKYKYSKNKEKTFINCCSII